MAQRKFSLILLVGLLYASAVIGARFIVGHIHPITYISIRLSAGAVLYILLLLFRFGGRRFPKDKAMWVMGILMGIFADAVTTLLINASLMYQSSGITTILSTLTPAVILTLAHFFLRDERMTSGKLAGIIMAFAGAALIAMRGESGLTGAGQADPRGYWMVFGAILVGAISVIVMRKHMIHYDPIEFTTIRLIGAALVLLPIGLLTTGFDLSPLPALGKVLLGYNTVNLCLTALLTFYMLREFGATSYSLVDYATTVLATLGGAVILHEVITAGILAGMALILAGVAIINHFSTSPTSS